MAEKIVSSSLQINTMSLITIAFLVILVGVIFLIWCESQAVDGIDRRLLEATRGDKALAKRLLEQAKFKYPGKSDRWYVEKILYDMGRDHGVVKARRRGLNIDQRDMRDKLFFVGAALWASNALVATIDNLFRR